MNYYEHHIGDYDTETSHLSWVEDLAYRRLVCLYYRKEKPIPGDFEQACRLVRAANREQKAAVKAVLDEFFRLEDDGYHQKTCDEVIEKYAAGEPEREVKKANENNRMARHREERARLFKIITDAGEHLPWNVSAQDLRDKADQVMKAAAAGKPATEPVTPPVTAPATPATATQTPDTRHQSPVSIPEEPNGSLSTSGKPTVAELQKTIDGIGSGLKWTAPDCPHQKILALWAEVLPEAIQHTTWEGNRMVMLRTRWKSLAVEFKWPDEATGLHWFKRFFHYFRKSNFLMGKVPPSSGHKQFELRLEWVVNATNWAKIRDGIYHKEG